MNRLKLLLAIVWFCGSAAPALGQYGQTAPGLRGSPPGGVGASVPSLSSFGVTSIAPPINSLPAASPPGSAPPVRRAVHPAVVRIVAPGRGSVSYGSGSLVAVNERHGLVITNWHVVNEATGQIMVEFADGFESPATIQKVDRDWDLAALAIWRPQVAPVPMARAAPRPGEMLTIAGYGPGKYRAISGQCTQYVSPGQKFPFEMVELAASARQGDSGGPILNSQGELAGVLFGEGQGRTAGSYCGRVQWFLDSVIGHRAVDAAPNTMIAQSPPNSQLPKVVPAPIPGQRELASHWPPRRESLPQNTEVWPPPRQTWPVQSPPSDAVAGDAPSRRSTADGAFPTSAGRPDVAGAAKRDGERPLQVASVGDGTGKAAVAPLSPSVAAPAGIIDTGAAAASDGSVYADRLEQLKAFVGVVVALGLLLLVIRSLASAGGEAEVKSKGAK